MADKIVRRRAKTDENKKSAQITFLIKPSDRKLLEAAKAKHGRSLGQEVLDRIIYTLIIDEGSKDGVDYEKFAEKRRILSSLSGLADTLGVNKTALNNIKSYWENPNVI